MAPAEVETKTADAKPAEKRQPVLEEDDEFEEFEEESAPRATPLVPAVMLFTAAEAHAVAMHGYVGSCDLSRMPRPRVLLQLCSSIDVFRHGRLGRNADTADGRAALG
jgi:hypothetical protein